MIYSVAPTASQVDRNRPIVRSSARSNFETADSIIPRISASPGALSKGSGKDQTGKGNENRANTVGQEEGLERLQAVLGVELYAEEQ